MLLVFDVLYTVASGDDSPPFSFDLNFGCPLFAVMKDESIIQLAHLAPNVSTLVQLSSKIG